MARAVSCDSGILGSCISGGQGALPSHMGVIGGTNKGALHRHRGTILLRMRLVFVVDVGAALTPNNEPSQ